MAYFVPRTVKMHRFLVSCARAVLQKYNLEDKLSETVLESLDNISNPSDYFENINNIILANNSLALKKAEAHALEVKLIMKLYVQYNIQPLILNYIVHIPTYTQNCIYTLKSVSKLQSLFSLVRKNVGAF